MAFKRELSDEFIEALRSEAAKQSGWWFEVLQDPTLLVGVRGTYLNVYWQGQALFDVKFADGKLQVTTHEKFLLDPDLKDRVKLKDGCFEIGKLQERGFLSQFVPSETLGKMKRAAALFADGEKTGCHLIAERNPNVVDFEIGLPVDAALGPRPQRIDLACFVDDGEKVLLKFWEAKRFANPELRAQAGDAPVLRQIKDYSAWITSHRAELENSFRCVAQNLVAFQAMGWRRTLHPAIEAVAVGTKPLTIDAAVPVGLLLFGYDQAQWMDLRWQGHKEKLTGIGSIRAVGNVAKLKLHTGTTYVAALPTDPSDDTDASEPTGIAEDREPSKAVVKQQLAELAEFADVFSSSGFVFGRWSQPGKDESRLTELPYYSFSEPGQAFHEAVYALGWITYFQWSDWMKTPQAKSLFESPAAVGSASATELRRLLTAIVRGERFCDGTMGSAFDSGILTAIVQRARTLLGEIER